jgi:hypothetical protein
VKFVVGVIGDLLLFVFNYHSPVLYIHSTIVWGTDRGPSGGHIFKIRDIALPKGNKNSNHLLMTLINMWLIYANFIKSFQPAMLQSWQYPKGHNEANVPFINIYFIVMCL